MKLCSRCRTEKNESEFSSYKKSRDGLFSWCKKCNRELEKGRYHALSPEERKQRNRHRRGNPDVIRKNHQKQTERYRTDPEYRAKILESQRVKYAAGGCERLRAMVVGGRYGLSPEEYAERVLKPCEICGDYLEPKTLPSGRHKTQMTIDHCHATDKLRGTLCCFCNSGLGDFMDDPVRLRLAADYIERYNDK